MDICYVLPCLTPCGGVRVLLEHANRLAKRGHRVVVSAPEVKPPAWFDVSKRVELLSHSRAEHRIFDVVVMSNPDTLALARRWDCQRRFYFVQMLEHLFWPKGSAEWNTWLDSYGTLAKSDVQVVTIAGWIQRELRQTWGVQAPIVHNGVNTKEFFPDGKKQRAILVEGDGRNCAKDTEGVGWRVALALRERYGVQVWGYATVSNPYAAKLDRFIQHPNTVQMRNLYSEAMFLVKASHWEGRALAPLEAAACYTPTVRAIEEGDDDLVDGVNCLRSGYSYDALLHNARRMLNDDGLRGKLTEGAYRYARRKLDWEPIIDKLEEMYANPSVLPA